MHQTGVMYEVVPYEVVKNTVAVTYTSDITLVSSKSSVFCCALGQLFDSKNKTKKTLINMYTHF